MYFLFVSVLAMLKVYPPRTCFQVSQTIDLLQAPYRTYKYLITREGRWVKRNIHLLIKKVYPPHQSQIFKQLYTFRKFLHPKDHRIFKFIMIQAISKLKKCLSIETILYLLGSF